MLAALNGVARRDDLVEKLAASMRDLPPENEFATDPEHLFAPGVYMRVLHMPAGSVIVSKIHKTEHFCIALSGLALVRLAGGKLEEIRGPRIMRTRPGTQRALVIAEDAVWLTIHPTEKTDVEEIENLLIAKTHDDPVLVALRDQSEG